MKAAPSRAAFVVSKTISFLASMQLNLKRPQNGGPVGKKKA
jgi:hypothetical protein